MRKSAYSRFSATVGFLLSGCAGAHGLPPRVPPPATQANGDYVSAFDPQSLTAMEQVVNDLYAGMQPRTNNAEFPVYLRDVASNGVRNIPLPIQWRDSIVATLRLAGTCPPEVGHACSKAGKLGLLEVNVPRWLGPDSAEVLGGRMWVYVAQDGKTMNFDLLSFPFTVCRKPEWRICGRGLGSASSGVGKLP